MKEINDLLDEIKKHMNAVSSLTASHAQLLTDNNLKVQHLTDLGIKTMTQMIEKANTLNKEMKTLQNLSASIKVLEKKINFLCEKKSSS